MAAKMSFDQGMNCMGSADYDTAADHFTNAAEADPHYEEAYEQLAAAYEKLGYAHRARKAWTRLSLIARSEAMKAKAKEKLGAAQPPASQ
jgi:Tfp pilus assembly protein PilF